MVNKRVRENLILVLIVLGMLAIASTVLFFMTKETNYVAAVDVENQNNQTNNDNVTFDAYFTSNNGHSIVADVNPEYPVLLIEMRMPNGGTLINPQVQFFDSTGGSNINFELGQGFGKLKVNEYISGSNATTKTIEFNNLDRGLNASFNVSISLGNTVEIAKLNETSKVTFTATYQDTNGNTSAVYKDIYLNIAWTANTLSMDLSQSVKSFLHQKDASGQDNLVVETEIISKINSSGKNNILPVKQTQIVVDVPTYKGIAPTNVIVTSSKTLATNGKDESNVNFDNTNYNYNAATAKLTITVENSNSSGTVPSVRGPDYYNVTYVYPQAAYDVVDTTGVSIDNKLTGTMILYASDSTINISKTINGTMLLTNYTDASTKLLKSPLYFNTIGEYTYPVQFSWYITNTTIELGDVSNYKFEIKPVEFLTNTSAKQSSYIGGINYVPITEISIPVASFSEALGASGYVEIYADSTYIGTITTSTKVENKNGINHYVMPIPATSQRNSEKIVAISSTPLANLVKLELYIYREISVDLPYTIEQIQNFKDVIDTADLYTSKQDDPNNFIFDETLTMEYNLDETYTNATLNIITPTLNAQTGKQELEFQIVLDNLQVSTDIWKTPTFDIVLPEYIVAIDKQITVGVNISDAGTVYMGKTWECEVLNNQIHIVLPFEGIQKARWDPQTIISVKANVTVNKYTPNIGKDIKLYYINTCATNYKNPSTWTLTTSSTGKPVSSAIMNDNTACGIATAQIDFINEPTLLCVSELSGYNGSNTINSIDNKDMADTIARDKNITPTMNLTIQNNHTVPVYNTVILGRIPYTNNKYAISNLDLGTNINTKMSEELTTTSGKNVTIYYSDNLNATKDIDLPANNWKTNVDDLSTVRSYLIVINDTLEVGEQIKFSYKFDIPAGMNYNKSLYTSFGAYYNANGTDLTSESDKIGLTTGENSGLKIQKTGTIVGGGDTAKEGDVIEYKIKVENTSDIAINNVVINDTIPQNTIYTTKDETGNYIKDPNKKEITENIGTINAKESKEYTFYVIVDVITENMTIENTANVSADGLETVPSNTSSIPTISTKKEAKLEVTKTSDIPSGASVKEGDIITYKIVVKNIGNDIAKNITIKDKIPEGTTYYDTTTNTVKPDIPSVNSETKAELKPEESFEFEFKVQVGRVKAGTTITNTATVVGDNIEDTPSNTEGIKAEITVPNLRLEKTSSIEEGKTVKEGDTITYTITVYNDGKTPAYDVEIKDKVPEYTAYYENNKKYKEKTDVGKKIEILEPGVSETYSFTVIVEEIPENTTIENTATVKGENGDEVPSNTIGVGAEISVPKLELKKTSSIEAGKIVTKGDIIEYVIEVNNIGDCIAHNVVVTDEIPEHTIYVEKTGNKYVQDATKKEIKETIGELQPGESKTIKFYVMVGELSGNVQINNTAKVNANNGKEVKSNTVGISAKPEETAKEGDLPYTGTYSMIIILSVAIISLSVFAVYEYKRIKR